MYVTTPRCPTCRLPRPLSQYGVILGPDRFVSVIRCSPCAKEMRQRDGVVLDYLDDFAEVG